MPDTDHSALPRTAAEARLTGSKHYLTSTPCLRGHIALRLTAGGCCLACARERMAKKNQAVREAKLAIEGPKIPALPRSCSVLGCGRDSAKSGLCNMHWLRKRRTGGLGSAGPEVNRKGQPVVKHCGKLMCPAANKLGRHLYYLRDTETAKRRAEAYNKSQPGRAAKHVHYLANRTELAASNRAWRRRNPERCRVNGARSLARRRSYIVQATPCWVDWKAIDAIYAACPPGYHIDHLAPLQADNICGLHTHHNLLPIPAAMNCSKRNRFDEAEMKQLIATYQHLLP